MTKEIFINRVKITVSDCGEISRDGEIVKLSKNGKGYKFFNVYNSGTGKNKIVHVHRIVAKLFCPNPNNYNVVNHIDGNRINNNYTNLEWCTLSHNCKHAIEHGLHILPKGGDCSWSKLKENQVLEIRRKYKSGGYTHRSLAREYGVSKSTIQQILSGRIWKQVS